MLTNPPPHPSFTATMELGPRVNSSAPDFTARNHAGKPYRLADLMGTKGLVLGFIRDMWQQASIQRIFWLERHSHTFIQSGFQVALLICDEPHTLYGFYVSSHKPPEFPLLSDVYRTVHQQFNMTLHPGLLLIDREQVIRHKWLVPDDRVWPKINEMTDILDTL